MQRYNSSDGLEELRTESMCDFKKVFHQTLKKAFHQALEDVSGEDVNVKGCNFHLSQSIWRCI